MSKLVYIGSYISESESENQKLFHYGTPHVGNIPHSGRYAYGSGEEPTQRATDLRSFAYKKRREINPETGKKYTDTEIAQAWGVSTTEFRKILSNERNAERAANIAKAMDLRASGMSVPAIAEQMKQPESTVNSWLLPKAQKNATSTANVADYLKEQVDEKLYLDVGKGVESQLGISKEKLKNALYSLKQEGYTVTPIYVEQATNPRQKTNIQVLTKDDVSYGDIYENRDQIRSPHGVWFEDNGETMRGIRPPVSIDSGRIAVRYGDEGGVNKDGVIEIRRGVEDLSLGQNHYAQVRIAVDGTHYLKGMAIYSDDIPKGYDIIFNTNKHSGTPMLGESSDTSVLKPLKTNKSTGEIDEDNPFGSTIRQYDYIDKNGEKHQSAINLVNTDENWNKWRKTLSSQVLSKQQPALAKRQLDLVYQENKDLFNDISKFPNDTIKKKLLTDLSEECDSAAVNLKAAALPRQDTKVILPLTNIKDNEVYAPTFNDGEEVVLIRYPHGGTFEMPRLTVNNHNQEGIKVLGDARKAIGINAHVAEQLSGADFDGDTVTVIPTAGQNIKTSPRLAALKDYEPKIQYAAYEGMPRVGKKKSEGGDGFNTQLEMGKISNLITDMTIRGASEAEIARAVKHSMVVIDAEKHNLNHKLSYEENQIAQLKEKWQGSKQGGSSTIISQAKHEERVPERDLRTDIDPETGEKLYFPAKGSTYVDKETGKTVTKTQSSTRMAETFNRGGNAYDLVSRDPNTGAMMPIEKVYADHANRMHALANEVRKEIKVTSDHKVNKDAKELYSSEIESLEAKLRVARMNAPNERLAQAAASKQIEAIKKDNPGMSKKDEMKIRSQIIKATRNKAGALEGRKRAIIPTDREWEAIISGVLSADKTRSILTYMDTDEVLRRTSTRSTQTLSGAKKARARAMLNAGYTWADVANSIGVSESTLRNTIDS